MIIIRLGTWEISDRICAGIVQFHPMLLLKLSLAPKKCPNVHFYKLFSSFFEFIRKFEITFLIYNDNLSRWIQIFPKRGKHPYLSISDYVQVSYHIPWKSHRSNDTNSVYYSRNDKTEASLKFLLTFLMTFFLTIINVWNCVRISHSGVLIRNSWNEKRKVWGTYLFFVFESSSLSP